MMSTWGEYLQLLGKVTKTLEELTGIEQAKTKAAMQGDVSGVEKAMKREQALSMTLRGYDRKRENMLSQLGMRGVPLSKIMEHCPEGMEDETRETAGALRRQYTIFQAASEVTRDTLEAGLHNIERMIVQQGGTPPPKDAPPPVQADFRI